MDHLAAIGTFVRIAETGSLSAAARATRRSLPAVSRSLAQLEQHLGVRLLQRTTRRAHLTEAGQRYFERCKRLLAEFDEANASVSELQRSLAGPITITAPILFGQMHVAPVVTEFLAAHAGVSVDLILTDRFVNIVEEGIDLAVRIGNLPDSGLAARRLATVRRVTCASPRYLKLHGTPNTPSELADHNCLQFSALSPTQYWEFHVAGKARQFRVQGTLSCNHATAMVDAGRSGLGIVMVLSYQVQEAVRRGELRILLEHFEPPPLPVHVVFPSGRMQPVRMRALNDLLADRLASKAFTDLKAGTLRKPARRESSAHQALHRK
jgi:DNA-binding transcriptional LysR family regulator